MQKMGRFLFFLFLGVVMANEMEDVRVKQTEMFSIAITPQMFNWTYQEFDKQYSFQTSLLNKPDLPSWLHYIYSVRHHSGFVYGTPPHDQKDIMIQTIALNRDDYETRRLIIPLHISRRENVATYQVQMKIDNLNVEDMLDEHRMERLKDVFRKKLWRDAEDMYTTFMASAIDLGARLPLRPSEGEGVVVKLGSHRPHSPELLQLQEEVKPLARMVWCPRDFKRTTVERLFRDAGFNLDWCAFKLVEVPNPYTSKPTNVNLLKYGATSGKLRNPESGAIEESPRPLPQWRAPTKAQVPQRGYAHEFTLSIILPLMVMVLLVSVLSLILCFQREGLGERDFVEFLHNLFLPCTQYVRQKRSNCKKLRDHGKAKSSHVNSDGTAAPGSRPGSSSANLNTFLADDGSNKSNLGISPNNSLAKPRSNPNLEVDYNRPQPPPYLGSNTNSLVLRQRQTVDEDLAAKKSRARTLEESLQLLNEANIVHRNYNLDGMILPDRLLMGDLLLADCVAANAVDEDYVPIKNDHSHRRNNGLINNGVNNNNGVLKGVNGF